MLADAIDTCTDELWARAEGEPPIWQHVLHSTYYLHKWIRTPHMPFSPPAWIDMDAVELVETAEPPVDRSVLRAYLAIVCSQSVRLIESADDEHLTAHAEVNGEYLTLADQVMSQIRHVTYHVGCISSILRRYTGESLTWVGYQHCGNPPV